MKLGKAFRPAQAGSSRLGCRCRWGGEAPLRARGEAEACGTALHALQSVFALCSEQPWTASVENAFPRNPGETSGLQTKSALLPCSSRRGRDLVVLVAVGHAVQSTPGLWIPLLGVGRHEHRPGVTPKQEVLSLLPLRYPSRARGMGWMLDSCILFAGLLGKGVQKAFPWKKVLSHRLSPTPSHKHLCVALRCRCFPMARSA